MLNEPETFNEVFRDLSLTVTEMFRDPLFFKSFSQTIIPKLKTYPFLNVWHAGCATGQEVYSLAIILYENKLLQRTRFYGTDFNSSALDFAVKGNYEKRYFSGYLKNYSDADGLFDDHEVILYGTNPFLPDTDGDGFSDGQEVLTLGTDPLDPSSP